MINYLIIIVILLTSINNKKINEIALTMIGYFLFRWITNYRKCTISYLECKLRGVKKDDGYIYNILNQLFDVNKKYNRSKYYILFTLLGFYNMRKLNKNINIY